MSLPKPPDFLLCCLAALATLPLAAQQSTPKSPPVGAPPWRQRALGFHDIKPLLGLSDWQMQGMVHCSNSGAAFINFRLDHSSSWDDDLYSVSPAAEVKHLPRKIPSGYSLSLSDFFVAEHTLVTLYRAERRDDGDTTSPPRDVRYFLSTSDYDGDQASLVSLDVKFKPLKVALFGSGDFLVLGWDEGNLLPLLAVVKPDGTIRRFIDLDRRTAQFYKAYSPIKEAESASDTHPDLATLQRAAFVPFGSQVMLTYPGTTKGFRILGPVSEDRTIPAAFPGGFVLHDVLPAGDRQTLVLRVEEKPDFPPAGKDDAASKPTLRIFEMSLYTGLLLREFTFDKPSVADVACAPTNRLTAIFYDTVANVVQPADANGNKATQSTESATQLVIATAPR
jgi:hypothetical protein